MDYLLSIFPGPRSANCKGTMPWDRRRVRSPSQGRGKLALLRSGKGTGTVKGQPWAGRNPSGDPGGGPSVRQLCGLAVLSTGTAIGDEGRRLSIARMLAPCVEEKSDLCVLKPRKFGGKSKPAVRLHSKHVE